MYWCIISYVLYVYNGLENAENVEIQGSQWDFGVFSGLEGVEKPNPKIYEIALEKAGNIPPEEALHIGDSMRKDYLPAKSLGMHALLLDRFKTPDALNWMKAGAPVFKNLSAVREVLESGSVDLLTPDIQISDSHLNELK